MYDANDWEQIVILHVLSATWVEVTRSAFPEIKQKAYVKSNILKLLGKLMFQENKWKLCFEFCNC